ncbi:hypothetical protein BJY04DRAFT_204169 [Aspergillus karnatakaensis]|uniref:uncharacterized protein n=1 Tax=Aspergillus karnatakaensis TaxID=1810916 RepID=UPI003CCD4DBF
MSVQRRIAWSWLAQAHAQSIHNSPAPFLYTTRTLNSTRPLRVQTPRCFNYATSKRSPNNYTDFNDETQSEPAPPRRSWLKRRALAITERRGSVDSSKKTSYREFNPLEIPESPTEHGNPTEPQPPADLEVPEKPGRSGKTISKPKLTTDEKAAIAHLLRQIPSERYQDAKQLASESAPSANEDEERREMNQVYAIFDAVLEKVRTPRPASERAVKAAPTYKRWKTQDNERGTPKAAKEKHDGLVLPDTDEKLAQLLTNRKMTPATAIKLVVEREALKIESALNAAVTEKGGSGIWAVCKERVFSMMHNLLQDKETAPQLEGLDVPLQEDDQATGTATEPSSPLQVPACIPLEPVITALYPRMLLVAFRLLNIHAPDSPLISQFRETISSFGRESIIIGTSTALCNELMYFHWRGEHDLPAVTSLLHQMHITGIEPDYRTLDVVDAIVKERSRNRGNGEDWWDLQPNRVALQQLTGETGWVEWLKTQVRTSRSKNLQRQRSLREEQAYQC